MHAKLNKSKIVGLMFALLLLSDSGAALAEKLAETFFQASAGEVSLPLQIAPELVDAPPRHVDLMPSSAIVKDIPGTSMPLSGFPVDLNEYPLLSLDADNQDPALYGVELSLDTRGKGAVDTIVRVGDPTLFPEMMKERIDLKAAEFVPNDVGYKIKRALGIGSDQKWRYTAINSKVNSVVSGSINADFSPGGGLVLTRSFDSLELEKTPWLRYQYELPKGSLWVVQINAKIDRGGLSPKLTTLLSRRFEGDGKQQILLNLNGLLRESYPGAKGGLLKELIINFHLDATASAAVANAHINLGKLEFYQAQMSGQGNTPSVFLIATDLFAKTNLTESLEKLISGEIEVLGGRLVGTQRDLSGGPEILPKVSLLAAYREKIPKLFVGEQFFLDGLNGTELSDVLDQRLFLEKQVLWESGRRDSKNGSFPLMSYMLDLAIDDAAFIEADYTCGSGGGTWPLLTLAGIDQRGQPLTIDYLPAKNEPIKVQGLHLRKITLAYRHEHGALLHNPCIVKNIQIISFKKSAVYRPKVAAAHIALGDIFASAPNLIWRANPGHYVITPQEGKNVWAVRSFLVQEKIIGDAVVVFDLDSPRDTSLSYFLRLRGMDGSGYFEKLFPLGRHGELQVSNMNLHGLDIVVKNDADHAVAPATLFLNQLELRHVLGLWQPDLSKMHKLDASLSYNQILEGGKRVVLPKRPIAQGEYRLIQFTDEGINITIDPSFSRLDNGQKIAGPAGAASSKLLKIGFVLAGGLVLLLGIKLKSRWMPFVNKALSRWWLFWGILIVLLMIASYLLFVSTYADAFSWGGLLLVIAYGVVVRYKARPYLSRKWDFLKTHYSAPYFVLALSLLLTCALALVLKQQVAAERIAVILYYLLVTGVVVEFISFAKEDARKIG